MTDCGFLSHDDVTGAIREVLSPLGIPFLTFTAEGGDVDMEGMVVRDGETLEVRPRD